MTAKKIANEYKFPLSAKHFKTDKFLQFKDVLQQMDKKHNLDEDVLSFVTLLCEKIAEGKKISIVEETELWNVTEAAQRLGVTRPTIYKMVERGDLEGVDFEGVKIVPSSVTAFLKRREGAKAEALKRMSEIDAKLKQETLDIVSDSELDDSFEEIDF